MRFKTHHEAGRKCVLLYVGDHDPAGLLISDVIKSNLMDCANVKGVDFDPSPIRVERIGLTREQIDDLGLPWIENLETGSGKDLGDPGHP
ncbi:MAG: terminase, partial [Mesorhizobium sp.]